jgi:ABC-type multidrug transport system ATPase subunit
MMVTLLPPTSGTAIINGFDVKKNRTMCVDRSASSPRR